MLKTPIRRSILPALFLFLVAFHAKAQNIPAETLHITGASHIDLAWKWTYERAKWICHYTFGSALDMMDDYDAPEFLENPVYYAQSNAHAYRWIETYWPEMFERIRRRVADGHWEIVGGMWVESDAMLPSGESFCRQFLHGQWYFQDHFGRLAPIGWLPDSFGYNANLPQFMKKAGIDYYFFYKLNWNDTHPPDYNLFRWRAPDGSEVLAHLAYGQYNNMASLLSIGRAVDALEVNEPEQNTVFFPLGIGNHGGGIVRYNLTRMLALRDAGYHVRFGRADQYFQALDPTTVEKVIDSEELYFESHRGTYTSRAEHKRRMRELEYALQNAEIFSSFAMLLGQEYPGGALDDAWKRLLRDQFHDTMAGTCLDMVYLTEVVPNMNQARTVAEGALTTALNTLAGRIDTTGAMNGRALIVFNPNGFPVSQVVKVGGEPDWPRVTDSDGVEIPAQYSATEKALFFSAAYIPAWGYRVYVVRQGQGAAAADYPAATTHLENDRLSVTLDETGYLVSLFNKELDFEFIAPGQRANFLQIYKGDISQFDSWNLGFDKYHEAPIGIEDAGRIEVIEDGPVRQVIEIERQGEAESYRQRIILYAGADAVDFETDIDNWGHPAHRFLKVAFPTALANERKTIRHNIPYGHLTRILDGRRADWEFVGHKWIDLTETFAGNRAPRAGLALYALEKYGYDVANDGPGEGLSDGACNILRLSLLKSGTSPLNTLPNAGGPVTDRGDFRVHYRIFPHGPATTPADLYRRGESYANPLLAVFTDAHAGQLAAAGQFLAVAGPGGEVLPTTLKLPHRQAGDRELVLRLVEIAGRDTTAAIEASAWDVAGIVHTDLLERPMAETVRDENEMPVGHYAVETFQLTFGDWAETADDDDAADDDDQTENPASDDDDDHPCCG